MAIDVRLENVLTGEIITVPIGFSWTTLLFGPFVPLLRGDFAWFLILFVLSMLTMGLVWIFVPFFYNKKYVRKIIGKGYKPADEFSKQELMRKGFYFKDKSKETDLTE